MHLFPVSQLQIGGGFLRFFSGPRYKVSLIIMASWFFYVLAIFLPFFCLVWPCGKEESMNTKIARCQCGPTSRSHFHKLSLIYHTIYSWDMQIFDGLFILSHKHKIILQKFTDAFSNAISTLSKNIKFFDQEMVRSGNDRILMQKIE